jgi:hypothetical protein
MLRLENNGIDQQLKMDSCFLSRPHPCLPVKMAFMLRCRLKKNDVSKIPVCALVIGYFLQFFVILYTIVWKFSNFLVRKSDAAKFPQICLYFTTHTKTFTILETDSAG